MQHKKYAYIDPITYGINEGHMFVQERQHRRIPSVLHSNRDKLISVKLTNRSKPFKGAVYSYCLNSLDLDLAGPFLLLTDRVTHLAYYGLGSIESLDIGFDEDWLPWADGAYLTDTHPRKIIASRCLALESAK